MTDQAPDQTAVKAYCNLLAIEKGLDPVGHAGSFDDAVLIETPLPWKRDIYQQAGGLPAEAIALLTLWLQRYHETGDYRHRPLLIAPDATYSRQGYRRVMFYTRPNAMSAQFEKIEYFVPEADLGGLLWALFEARENLPQYEAYRTPENDPVRDILVCTHGTIDAACAKFGYPLYNDLRQNYANEQLRVWRVSHFGGHVFAPTLIDMPTAHYWAYVEEAQTRQIVTHQGDVAAMRGHYRGWAGVDGGFIQAAEYTLWQQHGWDWFNYPKQGVTLSEDTTDPEHPLWAEVQIDYQTPDGKLHTHQTRVEVDRHIETITTTGNDHLYRYPQYRVVESAAV